MNNTEIAAAFYEAFARKDFKTMQSFYADNAVFSDPVFPDLSAKEVRAMWEMLISRGKNLSVDYKIGEADGSTVSASWTAIYTFTATGRHVVNHIHTTLVMEGGKIIRHTDAFNFRKWARQALGIQGLLFGSTPFLKNKVRAAAKRSLAAFLEQQAGKNK